VSYSVLVPVLVVGACSKDWLIGRGGTSRPEARSEHGALRHGPLSAVCPVHRVPNDVGSSLISLAVLRSCSSSPVLQR
jgi:hypothetical protein